VIVREGAVRIIKGFYKYG